MTRGAGQTRGSSHVDLFRRALVVCGAATLVVVGLLLVWYAVDVLLLVFASLLVAIFFRGSAEALAARTRLSVGWALAVVVLGVLALGVAAILTVVPSLAEQTDRLVETAPASLGRLEDRIREYGWGRAALDRMPDVDGMVPDSTDVLSRATGVVSTTLGAVANVLIVVVLGLYLALEPHAYVSGFVRLFPDRLRTRVQEVLAELNRSLWWWLMGQLVSMAVVGTATTIGLWLAGVPVPLALGVLSGLSEFVPTLGPLLASIPAVLVGLAEGPRVALYAAGVFLVVQTLESYVLMPLVNKRAVSLLPAMTISAQILMGLLVGGLGVLFATPLVLSATVLVQMLYLEDALGEDVTLPSETESDS